MAFKGLKNIGKSVNSIAKVSPRISGRLAFQLFIRPQRVRFKADSLQFIRKSKRLSCDFKPRLASYKWKSNQSEKNKKVFLLHGWNSNTGRWKSLAEAFIAKGYDIYAFDAPACGNSKGKRLPFNLYVDAALAFEAKYGPFDAYVGHSFGGGVVAQLLSNLPKERLPEAAVLLAPFDESVSVIQRYFQLLGYSEGVKKAFLKVLDSRLGGLDVLEKYSNKTALSNVEEVAGLIIHSRNDAVNPYEEGVQLHQAWKGSILKTYKAEGHRLRSDKVIDDVTNFVINHI